MTTELLVGWTVAPKDFRLISIGVSSIRSQSTVTAYDAASEEVVGSGTFTRYQAGSYSLPARLSGYPRAHIQGVLDKNRGYGTALYAGMCMTAHAAHEGLISISSQQQGDGICSGDDTRTEQASRWWSKAKKIGVAQEMVFDDEDGTPVNVDVFPYELAASHGLVVLMATSKLGLEKVPDPRRVTVVSVDALMSVDWNLFGSEIAIGDVYTWVDVIDGLDLPRRHKEDIASRILSGRSGARNNPSKLEKLRSKLRPLSM